MKVIRNILEFIGGAVVLLAVSAWTFNYFAEPEFLYSVTSSTNSSSGAHTLTLGRLNPYPMSSECYQYVFLHPSDIVIDQRELQWDYLIAMYDCEADVLAKWETSSEVSVRVEAVATSDDYLPASDFRKTIDSTRNVRITYPCSET